MRVVKLAVHVCSQSHTQSCDSVAHPITLKVRLLLCMCVSVSICVSELVQY